MSLEKCDFSAAREASHLPALFDPAKSGPPGPSMQRLAAASLPIAGAVGRATDRIVPHLARGMRSTRRWVKQLFQQTAAPTDYGTVLSAAYPQVHTQIEKLIQEHGDAIHTALFDPEVKIFTYPGLAGVVGFKILNGVAVTMGAPLCEEKEFHALHAAYRQFCRKKNLSRMYMGVTNAFLEFARTAGFGLVDTGIEQSINPHHYILDKVAKKAGKNAANQKVTLHELNLKTEGDKLQLPLTALVEQACGERKGTQVFACAMQPFAAPTAMRWFYAMQDFGQGPQPVGLLTLLRTGQGRYAIDGCVQIQTLGKNKVNGNVTHVLHAHVLEHLKAHEPNCSFVSFGLTERAEVGPIENFPGWRRQLIQWGHRAFAPYLHSKGKFEFRGRYADTSMSSYLVLDPPRLGLAHMLASARSVHLPRREVGRLLWTQIRASLSASRLGQAGSRLGRIFGRWGKFVGRLFAKTSGQAAARPVEEETSMPLLPTKQVENASKRRDAKVAPGAPAAKKQI